MIIQNLLYMLTYKVNRETILKFKADWIITDGTAFLKIHAKSTISCFRCNHGDVVILQLNYKSEICRGSVEWKEAIRKKILFCRLYSGLSRLLRLLKDLQAKWIRLLSLVTHSSDKKEAVKIFLEDRLSEGSALSKAPSNSRRRLRRMLITVSCLNRK